MADTTAAPEVTLDQLQAHLLDNSTVIDVREISEYVEGHIPGAVPVPMGQLPSHVGELNTDDPVIVVCASGNRSAAMTDFLRNAGFDAYSVAGGTSAWAGSGRPIVTGSGIA